jgi:hypothetical protein
VPVQPQVEVLLVVCCRNGWQRCILRCLQLMHACSLVHACW